MAYYLVSANVKDDLAELRMKLDMGEIAKLEPFGEALEYSLANARVDGKRVVWEEEDDSTPPLKMEREAVLDTYFTDLQIEPVQQGKGWERIQNLPYAWGL